jgi:HAD superfamily hydrolase (TIGR01490 family)
VGHPRPVLERWHREFMATKITPILLPKAEALLASHRNRGHDLLIITATNEFITRPIANLLGVSELIACEGEVVGGVYTGEPRGIPSFHAGKVTRLNAWLAQHNMSLDGAYFYSDSHNDLPLLELVDNPVAVDPDDTLRAYADKAGWPVMSLRD